MPLHDVGPLPCDGPPPPPLPEPPPPLPGPLLGLLLLLLPFELPEDCCPCNGSLMFIAVCRYLSASEFKFAPVLAFASDALLAPVLAWIAVFVAFDIAPGSCAPTCTAWDRKFCPVWM